MELAPIIAHCLMVGCPFVVYAKSEASALNSLGAHIQWEHRGDRDGQVEHLPAVLEAPGPVLLPGAVAE